MWLIVDALLGILLGLSFAWTYSVREAHRTFRRNYATATIPTAIVVSRVLSIALTLILLLVSNVIVRAFEPSWLKLIVYAGLTIVTAIATWLLIFKPRQMPM